MERGAGWVRLVEPILADPSLLTPLQFWDVAGDTDIGTNLADRHGLYMKGAENSQISHVQQSMRTWGLGGEVYMAVLGYKRASPNNSQLYVQIEVRELAADDAGEDSCDYLNNLDLNTGRPVGSFETCDDGLLDVTGTSSNELTYSGIGCNINPSWDGAEIRLTVWKASDQAVFLDHANLLRMATS